MEKSGSKAWKSSLIKNVCQQKSKNPRGIKENNAKKKQATQEPHLICILFVCFSRVFEGPSMRWDADAAGATHRAHPVHRTSFKAAFFKKIQNYARQYGRKTERQICIYQTNFIGRTTSCKILYGVQLLIPNLRQGISMAACSNHPGPFLENSLLRPKAVGVLELLLAGIGIAPYMSWGETA